MQIHTEPKKLIAALKAVREFTSDDPTRYNLCDVYAERSDYSVRFTATDGHTLCSVEIPCVAIEGAPVMLTEDAIKALLTAAKTTPLKQADFTLPTDPLNPTFPEYQQVLPAKITDMASKAPMIHGFNAVYLARLADVQKALKSAGARIQVGATEHDAMRADIKGDLGEAVVVVMPMRLGWEAPKKVKKGKAKTA